MSEAGVDKAKEPERRRSNEDEDYGYGYYPSRSQYPNKMEEKPKHWFVKLNERKSMSDFQCQTNVAFCMENSKMIKMLVGALKKNGCDFNVKRHVSCEDCVDKVNGGYDIVNNQIVVCKNSSASKGTCCSVMAHELIHMFDACRAKLDFKNIEHVACTEIRASAICHCGFLSAASQGLASIFNFKKKHQECTKEKAIMSVLMVRNVTYEDAKAAVDKVFTKCYNDLEPFGRIPERGKLDIENMYMESLLYY